MIPGLVSTVIPVHNRPQQLLLAVESVLAQDYHPIEILIVDDGSTDETPQVAQALAAAHPGVVQVIHQPNQGPGGAREAGRLLARGEFIQYLDSDDVLLPGKFTAQVQALRSDGSADVAYGITYLRDAGGELHERPHKRTGETVPFMFPTFLNERWWETATPLYRRSLTDKAGSWTSLRLEEDWEYDCRVAALGGKLVWTPQPVSETRDHAGARLSIGSSLDPVRNGHRAAAHALVFSHAMRAAVPLDSPEMRQFARSLFLLSRQCGASGLPQESRMLFELSRRAAGQVGARRFYYLGYRAIAAVAGWVATGKLSHCVDKLRDHWRVA